ncbi:sodium/calcium exchanger 2-like isoform X2 [Saccostrea echinata]|uniref:sodium/calcium exchanger 2-like isoform X2 n=1 Tax=Saccostrea echinata TaxID=191078 RepID=UPI002A839532|nr:sodium/calcium exchanger 2-like isoform X2 [Saccostrea echinata]
MVYELRTNYGDRGYVVEYLASNTSENCKSWILVPAENLWPEWLRGLLYVICMAYFFLGVAISSDIFMNSIEVLTSKKRTVKQWDPEKNEMKEVEVFIWNETVANLTLMALGSSAPEILLATFEAIGSLGTNDAEKDSLGTFTIIGSAAFNLLIITSVCVVSVHGDEPKYIKEFGVFLLTSFWSLWAYIWLLLAVQYITPGIIDPWEAWVTLLYMPLFVFLAYATDNGWWRDKCCKKTNEVDAQEPKQMDHIRIMTNQQRRGSFAGHATAGKELHMLEVEKQQKLSVLSLQSLDKKPRSDDHLHPYGNDRRLSLSPGPKSAKDINVSLDSDSHEKDHDQSNAEDRLVKMEKGSKEPQQTFARARNHKNISTSIMNRARFRHAVVSAMTGTKKRVGSGHKSARFAELVKQVQSINQASKEGKMPAGDLYGKFTFASDRYAVLESAGKLTIDVLFHRNMPKAGMKAQIMNGDTVAFKNGSTQPTSIPATANPASKNNMEQVFEGTVTVEYETREGSGKAGKDFKYRTGVLTFKDTEYRQSITIDIINDNQFENDCDFYLILKNATNGTSLGDPSVTRITIVDDDEPGEFQFESPHVYADLSSGKVKVTVQREFGVDGKVTMEYSTIDGTAVGGTSLSKDVDYIQVSGTLEFKHQETSKTIEIKINKEAKGSKNFVIALKNPSLGAKIGHRSAVVCHINKESIEDRIAEVIKEEEEEEPVTWAGQFKNAMSIEGGQDDDGNDIPPTFMDYLLHFLTFFWKILGAMVPPTTLLGAWPAFVFSLVYIALLTLVIEQLGHLLGCVVGLKTSVAGITIIALGTSLPDTFASRTAAIQDEHADAAIGNVTGSNSVNVFLGLGLPWVLSTMYAYATGTQYKVPTGNLTQSVIIFSTLGALCILILVLRRKFVGGELGGKNRIIKWGSSLLLFFMWMIYIVLASLKAYDILDWEV